MKKIKALTVITTILFCIGLFIILYKLSIVGWYDFSETIPYFIGGGVFILASLLVAGYGNKLYKKRINEFLKDEE